MEDYNKCELFIRGECNTPNNCCDFKETGTDIRDFAEFLKHWLDGRCNGLRIQGFIDDAVREYLKQSNRNLVRR